MPTGKALRSLVSGLYVRLQLLLTISKHITMITGEADEAETEQTAFSLLTLRSKSVWQMRLARWPYRAQNKYNTCHRPLPLPKIFEIHWMIMQLIIFCILHAFFLPCIAYNFFTGCPVSSPGKYGNPRPIRWRWQLFPRPWCYLWIRSFPKLSVSFAFFFVQPWFIPFWLLRRSKRSFGSVKAMTIVRVYSKHVFEPTISYFRGCFALFQFDNYGTKKISNA